jgi:dephospho-CoA kinase|nr:dephospho-CoA kinase [Candidatus Krumholzibacteria bacterium]
MIRWVVTGPIGAGKSAVSGYLVEQGAALVDGDQLGHLVLTQPEIVTQVCEAFGNEVAPDGVVDRQLLGHRVFGNPVGMNRLNAITHGPICRLAAEQLDQLAQKGQHQLAVLEAAMYFLFPSPPSVDLVLAVLADPEVRRRRLMASRGLTDDQINARLAAQTNLEPLWYGADVLVKNETTLGDLHHQLDLLLARYCGRPLQG